MVKSYITKNPSQTRKLGEKLAKEILMKKPHARDPVPERSSVRDLSRTEAKLLVLGFVTVRGRPRTRDFVTVRGRPKKAALIMGLEGELGGGKTTFLQGFARGLGIKEKILSPTFIIMRKSKIQSPKSKYKDFYHIDCYRIQKPKEILDLDFKKIISDSQNIVVVEWAERVQKIFPKNTLILKFEFVDKNKRKISLKTP